MFNNGEVNTVKKAAGIIGNPRNFPHTKRYFSDYGGTVMAGLSIVAGICLVGSSILDFFFTKSQDQNKQIKFNNNHRGDRNNNVR